MQLRILLPLDKQRFIVFDAEYFLLSVSLHAVIENTYIKGADTALLEPPESAWSLTTFDM